MISELKNTKIGEICKDWEVKKLDEVCSEIIDCLHSKKPDLLDQGKFVYLEVKNISFDGKLDLSEIKYVTKEVYSEWIKRLQPQYEDIVITKTGRVGAVAMIPQDIECCIGRNQVIIRVNRNVINPYFLLYYLLSPNFKGELKRLTLSGTILDSLHVKNIPKIRLPFPEIEEQDRIVEVLYPIYKKIKINCQMNDTLEKIAEAIFKSWLIDFDPFQDGEFVESELGKIPKNWEICKYTNKFSVGGGGTPKTKIDDYWNGDICWATGKDISQNNGIFLMDTDRKITKLGLSRSSAKLYPKDTTVITARGTVGKLKILSKNIAISQTCYALLAKNNKFHIYLYLLTSNMIETLKNRAYGAIFDTITTRIFEDYDIIYPPESILNRFDEIVIPIYEKILSNQKEIEIFSTIINLLLPQLISGRLRTKNPEKFLEEISN